MEKQYIEYRDDGYWVAGARVSLDSIVLAFLEGLSPETIAAECYPVLTLEQVYGAITYYLSHKDEIDVYLKKADTEFASLHKILNEPAFARKIAAARRRIQISQS